MINNNKKNKKNKKIIKYKNMDSKENKTKQVEYIIPFINRKSLLSISFRALNLEMTQYKMKVDSLLQDELKEPLVTGLCEVTMVNKFKNNIIIILFIFIGTKISNRFQK